MKELKLLVLMAVATAWIAAALYWSVGSPWNELMALVGGVLYGFAIGVFYGVEKMYQHVQGNKPDSDTTFEILRRVL